jgi:succinoglycan biosynthesis transport protein ExoP
MVPSRRNEGRRMNNLTPATHAPPYSHLAYDSDATYPMADVEHLVTIRDILRVLRVHWRVILAAAAAVAGLAMLAVSLITPTYMGAALVMVDEQQRHVFNEQADPSVLSELPSDPSSIESQVQMLQSHALAGQVVDKLKLVDDPEFNGTKVPLTDRIFGFIPRLISSSFDGSRPLDARAARQRLRERTISKFQGGLDAQAVGLSTIIAVNFRSTSAEKAARIANTVANTYIENLTTAKSSATEGASKWLADRVTQLGRQAAAADAAVQQYKAANGLVDTSNGTAMTDEQLGALTAQLVQAEGDQAQAQSKFVRVQQMIKSGHSADVTDVVTSPLIAQLREQEATLLQQRADLSSRYGPLHPAMQNVQARVGELRQKISEEVNRIVGTASNDAVVAAARVGAIKSNMAAATSSTAVQNRARIKLGELAANASSAHALYQSYLDRLKQTQQRVSLNTPDVHLASPAPVPLAPVAPKKLLIVGGATLVSLVLGFLAALVADRMCNGFRSSSELEAALGLPVLAAIPQIKPRPGKRNSVALEILRKPHSQFSEAFRGLEIGLSLQMGRTTGSEPTSGKVILVTSALPAEGKTSTAVNLARRLATSGHRVVIVDADQRRPTVAATLGLRNVRYSLADCLAQRCSLEEALSKDPYSPVIALPGAHSENDIDLNGSRAMALLIGRLRETADFVVIDSPPVLAVHDAKLLAQMTDGTIFVVRWGKTSREAVSLAVKLLREFRVKLIGTVLARANAKQYQYYAFGYAGVPALAKYYEG